MVIGTAIRGCLQGPQFWGLANGGTKKSLRKEGRDGVLGVLQYPCPQFLGKWWEWKMCMCCI